MKSLFTFLCSFIILGMFAQSPWTQKKGNFYTQVSFSTISDYGTLFGDINTERFITDNTLQLYAEYGLTDRSSLIFSLPFKMIETGDANINQGNLLTDAATERSLGNLSLGIKHNFYNKNWLFTGQLNIEANTGSFFENSGIRTGFDAWTITPMVSAGRGFGKSYLQAFLAAELRTNDYSSNIRFGGEFGYKLFQKLWLVGFVDISNSLENGDIVLPTTNQLTGLFVNDIEFGAYGLKGIVELTQKFGITAGYATAFSGNNVPKKTALTFGLYQRF